MAKIISEEIKRDIARNYEDSKIESFISDICLISETFDCRLSRDEIKKLLDEGDEDEYLIDFQVFPRFFRFKLSNTYNIHRRDLIDYVVSNYLLGLDRQRYIRMDDENIIIEGNF